MTTIDDDSDEFDTLFAVVWCDISFSFIEREDAEAFKSGITHAKTHPDYPPEVLEDDRKSAFVKRGFDLFWKMRYYFAAEKMHFAPDTPKLIVRDKEEIAQQKIKQENKIPDMFDFMF